jgi:hypothetical protein
MATSSRPSTDWYEDDAPSTAVTHTTRAMTGLPPSWQHYGLRLCGLVFLALWMVESWKSGRHLAGMTAVNHLTKGLWGALFTLLACYALFHFWKRRSMATGYVSCFLVAGGALLGHWYL